MFVVLFASLFHGILASDLSITLVPMTNIPTELNSFEGFWFEIIEPAPTTARVCELTCSINSIDPSTGQCYTFLDPEMICHGKTPVDLSINDHLSFSFDASASGNHWIEVTGDGRTRIEFQAAYHCNPDIPEQSFEGADISWDFVFYDNNGAAQVYEYDPSASFVNIGKCDGCGYCEIYTRMQFNPVGGVLRLNFDSLNWRVGPYDSTFFPTGAVEYYWGTDLYTWVRDSQNRRELQSRRQLSGNSYVIHEKPASNNNGTDGSGGSAASLSLVLVASVLALFI